MNPVFVPQVKRLLRGSAVKVCCVVGFPLGAQDPQIKPLEARRAIREGAQEIDMVINVGALKGKDDALVLRDIRGVVEACKDGRALSKVILETALLTDEEKVRACELAMKAGADFVKTSTGFSSGGATAEDVALMARTVAPRKLGVKASGGIRTYADVLKMVKAGRDARRRVRQREDPGRGPRGRGEVRRGMGELRCYVLHRQPPAAVRLVPRHRGAGVPARAGAGVALRRGRARHGHHEGDRRRPEGDRRQARA